MEHQPLHPKLLGKFMLIDNDPKVWENNKIKMLEILNKAPITGVYKNEDPKHWDDFFQFYIDFLNAQIGPRGQCAKRIRKQLKQNKQIVDQALKPYNLNHQTHIRSIYVQFKFFVPCREYHEYQTTIQTLEKSTESLKRLKQTEHPMYISIKQGLLKKRGPDFPYQQEIQRIKKNYQKKIQQLNKDKIQYELKLSSMKEYQNYLKLNNVMKKWFDEWVQADSGMGKDSCNRGQIFQDKVLINVIPYILKKQRNDVFKHILQDDLFSDQNIHQMILQANQNNSKKDKFNRLHIFVNMKWNPRSLGQIDITIAQYIEQSQRYEALILIQCKARLFDIRQASYQVYPQFFEKQNKHELSGKYGPVYLSPKVVSYIVTTLPDFDFVLPIQSDLKATLDKNSKDKPIQTIKQNQMKQIIFNKQLSPLQWFKLNNCDRIIILSSQT